MARGSKPKARRKPAPKKRRVPGARLERPTEGPAIRSSARKSRGFEEGPREEVRPDDAEFLH